MGAVAHCLHHLWLHAQHARLALLLAVEHAACDHELDEVDVLLARTLDLGERLVDGDRRDGDRARHVAARHRDRLVGREDARAEEVPRHDLVAAARVEVGQAAHGAHRGDAAHELGLREASDHAVRDGTRQPVGHDLLDERLVVALLFLGLAVSGQVHVHIDEAGHEVAAFEVVYLAPRVGALFRLGYNRLDRVARRDEHHALEWLHILRAVEDRAIRVRDSLLLCCAQRMPPLKLKSSGESVANHVRQRGWHDAGLEIAPCAYYGPEASGSAAGGPWTH